MEGWSGGPTHGARGGMGAGLSYLFLRYSFSGPVAVGDSALYYVLCDESCLTADKPGGMEEWSDGVMEWWSGEKIGIRFGSVPACSSLLQLLGQCTLSGLERQIYFSRGAIFPRCAGVPGIVEPGGLGGEESGDLRDFDFRPDSARQVPVGPDRSRFGLVVP
jgi:hypothetical protein